MTTEPDGKVNLRRRREAVLRFLDAYQQEHNRPPTHLEIQASIKYHSVDDVRYHLKSLLRTGYLARRATNPQWLELTPKAREALAGRAAAGGVLRRLERIFPAGESHLCDICGQAEKQDQDAFCATCRAWLVKFAQRADVKHPEQDMARCLAMMLRYGERPWRPARQAGKG